MKPTYAENPIIFIESIESSRYYARYINIKTATNMLTMSKWQNHFVT